MANNPFAIAATRLRSAPVARPNSVGGRGGGYFVPSYQDKIPQWSKWDSRRAIEEGYKSSTWVYKCVERLMKAAASVPWVAHVRQGDEWQPEPDHPLTTLIEHPNPFMGRQKLMEWMTAHLYLAGNSLLKQIKVGRTPVELWPIFELWKITVVPSSTDFIDRYEFRRDGAPLPIDPMDVVHTMFPDPGNPFWGMGPLQAAARTVDTDVEAVRWNKLVLQNRAVTDGVFSFQQMLSPEDFDIARLQVREQYSGADNARTPWVLGGGADYHQMSMTPAEMDYLESRKFTVEEICAAFGVPLPMVGIYRDATLANIETARKIFWEDTVIPFLDDVKDALNRALVPSFGRTGQLELRYDTSSVPALREDLTEKIAQLKALTSVGVPLNVAIQRLKLAIEPVDGGDVGMIPATMVPITDAGEGAQNGPPPPIL